MKINKKIILISVTAAAAIAVVCFMYFAPSQGLKGSLNKFEPVSFKPRVDKFEPESFKPRVGKFKPELYIPNDGFEPMDN